MYIINFIRGFFMAMADSVPGVSGGTIAFLMGFYDNFIGSLDTIVSPTATLNDKKKSFAFLLKLGIGWVLGMISSILFLSSILNKEIYNISSLFCGLIIFSIPIIIKEEKQHLIGYYKNVLFVFLAILLVLFISFFNPSSSTDGVHYSLNNFSIPLAIYVFFCGMIAISAMVLPGISGSTLLLIFGLYGPIINALKETLTFNFSYLPILIVFGLGVLSGIFISIRLIKWLLTNYRSKMIYLILGLMIGSIYAVFIGPTTLDSPQPAMNLESFSFIFFAIGGSLIYGLNLLSNRFK